MSLKANEERGQNTWYLNWGKKTRLVVVSFSTGNRVGFVKVRRNIRRDENKVGERQDAGNAHQTSVSVGVM